MWKRTLILLSIVGLLCSCDFNKKESARLQSKTDSLQAELNNSREDAKAIQGIEALIDTIDVNRHVLRVRMSEGTTMEEYTRRLENISDYVKETYNKIASLESRISSSHNVSSIHVGTIKKLKHDLEIRNQELASLQEQVAVLENEKSNLNHTVSLQKEEISDKSGQIKARQEDVVRLQDNLNNLVTRSKVDEADSYFAQAKLWEDVADHIKFAPRKKKNTRKEALDLYKMAALLGNVEADEKVKELSSKM